MWPAGSCRTSACYRSDRICSATAARRFTAAKVAAELERAQAGSIVLLHMNHPESGTVDGVRAALPSLRDRGLRFVLLSDYPLE
jgi:peptidoglycan/xylan/chitin deacetylase (PgdA/CDA1 family)